MIVTFTEQADTYLEVLRGVHDGIRAFFCDSTNIPLPSITDKKAFSLDIVVSEVEGYDFTDTAARYDVTVRMEMGR